MATKKKMLQAAAGNAGGAGPDVEDVFSTYLYTGTGAAQTINNGIDLAGEGGLTWLKERTSVGSLGWHSLYDTERGVSKYLSSNTTSAEASSGGVTAFNSNGFTLGDTNLVNQNTGDFASWTFRKAPKFFDVVTYTGNGTNQTISHNLGSVAGMIIVKDLDTGGNWRIYHRSLGNTYGMDFSTQAKDDDVYWNDTTPTDAVFTVGPKGDTNTNGTNYVAYLFAHNDGDGEFGADGDADIIKCGSYTGNGSTNGPEIDLGFEPQWLLVKSASSADVWMMTDNMRGMINSTDGNNNVNYLKANTSDAESGFSGKFNLTSTGFKITDGGSIINGSGNTYIYMAIRRPTKVPESETEVFDADTETNLNTFVTTPWPTDLAIQKDRQQANQWVVIDRMRGGSNILDTSSTSAENTNGTGSYFSGMDYMDGIDLNFFSSDTSNNIVYNWKRAPNFFDVVAYTGNGTAGRTVSHNLGVAPEMMWVKKRDSSSNSNWSVYHKDLNGGTNSAEYYLRLETTNAETRNLGYWDSTSPSDSAFTLGTQARVNSSGNTFIAYLFASLDGISKVGSFTGDGTTDGSKVIDCGFTSGARFILIKRSGGTGNWWVWDTVRGVQVGNDPVLGLNLNTAETQYDWLDPDPSGFKVINPNTNNSGSNYIFYAIA